MLDYYKMLVVKLYVFLLVLTCSFFLTLLVTYLYYRQAVPDGEPTLLKGKCNYHQQTATCYSHECPIEDGDYLVYVDMRVHVEPWRWSYVYTEAFYAAMTSMFKLRPNHVELLNDAGNEYTPGTKLHFQMRLRSKDFSGVLELHKAATTIATDCQEKGFGTELIQGVFYLYFHFFLFFYVNFKRFLFSM